MKLTNDKVIMLHCMSLNVCRFSVAGVTRVWAR